MNKYQETLDYIKQYMEIYDELNGEDNISKLNKMNVNILQELVDNYSKIQQFDKAVFFNADGLVVDGVSYEQLEKALDKACEELEVWHGVQSCYQEKRTRKQWKEWLLKDE